MAKFKAQVTVPTKTVVTARMGTTGAPLVDNDKGKFVKLAADSQYNLCTAGDPIEGVFVALESATQDGYAIGSVQQDGRVSAICDGLEATPGTGTIAVGDYVVCGTVVAAGTALTSTTGPKVTKATYQPKALAATASTSILAIPVTLSSITAAGDILTTYTPGYKFKILAVDWAQGVPVTTAAKAANLNVEIGTTNLTGGVVALTSATCTPLGKVIAGTEVTAANTGSATDTISIEAADVTAFAEGTGYVLLKIQNLDTYEALAAVNEDVPGWKVISLGNAGAVGDTCVIERV